MLKTFLFSLAVTLTLVGLRLYGVVAWPWLWVTSPVWLFVAVVTFFFGVGLAALITVTAGEVKKVKKAKVPPAPQLMLSRKIDSRLDR